jgi:hypothetical protein
MFYGSVYFFFFFSFAQHLFFCRVVGYDFAKTPKANGVDASYLLGQPTWSSAIQAPPSPTSLGGPVAIYGDGKGGLFVADNAYNRVVRFFIFSPSYC